MDQQSVWIIRIADPYVHTIFFAYLSFFDNENWPKFIIYS